MQDERKFAIMDTLILLTKEGGRMDDGAAQRYKLVPFDSKVAQLC